MSTHVQCIAAILLLATLQGCSAVALIPQFYETAIIAIQAASTADAPPAGLIQPAILLNDISTALANPNEGESGSE